MYVEICKQFGGETIRIPASQVVVFTDDGTPLAVASVYGPRGSYLVESAHTDPDRQKKFHESLRLLGLDRAVSVVALEPDAPPTGARLLL